jgi:hypothetical protein
MLYAGLDLSRKRLDFHLLDGDGGTVEVGAAPPDEDGLDGLTERLARHGAPIRAAIESMNGALAALRARSARAGRVAGRDRRCAEGERPRTAGLQDRPDRRLGTGRARSPRAGAGDLVAHSSPAKTSSHRSFGRNVSPISCQASSELTRK